MTNRFYNGPSLRRLHDEFAKKYTIDKDAPVRGAVEVEIDAPLTRVWELLSNVEGWPLWNPGITSVQLDSGVAVDATFTWVSQRARMRSKFAVVEPLRELTWTGVSLGIKGIHRNILRKLPDGRVLARTEESMASPLLRLIFSERKLRSTLSDQMARLKQAAEQTA
ncbi:MULTISPECIES: SRPBCC family protein [unclassified Streptomyces]|uniref:SRPBCC family protein n=1 Tax=unclassified Streptomyces TaxID=2593676 RepID=UPI0027413B92|nr:MULTISPECIES: SRPBCC family protein [unclassified Streptomyces]